MPNNVPISGNLGKSPEVAKSGAGNAPKTGPMPDDDYTGPLTEEMPKV